MRDDARHRLEAVLNQEMDVARLLAQTLAEERSALAGPSPDLLAELAATKTALFRRLEELETVRSACCQAAGVPLRPDAPSASWSALMDLILQCRTANEINGYIINVRRHQVEGLLGIVRGGSALTYGPQGKATAKALHALARA